MKKSTAVFSRRFKSIPGNLKLDISAPYDNMPCCLTSNLWEVEPFPDNRSRRPTREIEEFPPIEVHSPMTTYKYVRITSYQVGYVALSLYLEICCMCTLKRLTFEVVRDVILVSKFSL